MTVRGAAGEPNPPLKEVSHDVTLTGTGAATAPLGIANGGVGTAQLAGGAVTSAKLANGVVSPSKLATGIPPAIGQLLSFDGVNLAWRSLPPGGMHLYDSLGHDVGVAIDDGTVLRKIGGIPFRILVTRSGFYDNGGAFYHTSTDCSGSRYVTARNDRLAIATLSDGHQLFYATEPIQTFEFQSWEYFKNGLSQPPTCVQSNPAGPGGTFSAGLLGVIDLSTLGLVPPFHLEF
jgi:hypothetical protein